jgi:hypothetical protein
MLLARADERGCRPALEVGLGVDEEAGRHRRQNLLLGHPVRSPSSMVAVAAADKVHAPGQIWGHARGRGEADEATVCAPHRLHASLTGRDQWRRAGG